MFEARDGLEDTLFTAIRRDDLPTADGCWQSDSLLCFVLLDGGFNSARGYGLKKSAHVPIAIADYARRMPAPVAWAAAAAKCCTGGSNNSSEPKPYPLFETQKEPTLTIDFGDTSLP